MTAEEKIAKVKDLRPIDDVFFEVLADDKRFCEEILRIILEDKDLTVEDVVVQGSERNIYGRSVRLDALCTLGSGSKCNIEVQRADNDDHLRRARFNAASITVKDSDPGERFENITELYIVYISEFDVLKGGLTIYHIDKTIRENGRVVDDGLHEIFVNTAIDDGTEIAELMSCFEKKEVINSKFPVFTQRMKELKTTEGGASAVCEVMQKYLNEAKDEARIESIAKLLSNGGTEEDAKRFLDASPEEIARAKESLFVCA